MHVSVLGVPTHEIDVLLGRKVEAVQHFDAFVQRNGLVVKFDAVAVNQCEAVLAVGSVAMV